MLRNCVSKKGAHESPLTPGISSHHHYYAFVFIASNLTAHITSHMYKPIHTYTTPNPPTLDGQHFAIIYGAEGGMDLHVLSIGISRRGMFYMADMSFRISDPKYMSNAAEDTSIADPSWDLTFSLLASYMRSEKNSLHLFLSLFGSLKWSEFRLNTLDGANSIYPLLGSTLGARCACVQCAW